MSSYDASSYDLPIGNQSQLKNISYVQLDMKNSMLQNRLARSEKLLDEYEKKGALYGKAMKLVNKYVNALSNGAKRFLHKSLKMELANFMQAYGGFNEMTDLIEILTDFIGNIKLLKVEKSGINDKQRCSAKSVDCDKETRYAMEELLNENNRLKAKLDKINKGTIDCFNCHAKIDIKKILASSKPLMMQSNVLSHIAKQGAYDSMMQSKTLEISQFSEMHSLHSMLREDKNEINNKGVARLNIPNQRDSICIEDSSVFLKKNNLKSHNTTVMPMLSINDTVEEIKIVNDKSCMNWIIKEIEDSEKTETDYSMQSIGQVQEETIKLNPRKLLDDFNKVADSYQNSFSIQKNAKDQSIVQMYGVDSFSINTKHDKSIEYIKDLQQKLNNIDLSHSVLNDTSNIIDKTLNSVEPTTKLQKKKVNDNSDQRLMKSQETLKVEAVYAFRQQKYKASPRNTSVDEDSLEFEKVTKRVSFIRNANDGLFKSMRSDVAPKQPQTTRNLLAKGLQNSKSGINITAKTKVFNKNEKEELHLATNTTTSFYRVHQLQDEKQKPNTGRMIAKPQPVIRTLCSTEKTLNNMLSNNITKNSQRIKKAIN